VTSQE